MKSQARVVVIGGGVVSCSVAYHLTRAGCSDVLLLERADLTAGSTWHAAANIHAMHGNASLARLRDYSIRLYDSLEKETGQSCGLHRCGGLYLATSGDRFDELKVQRARARYLGQEFEIIGCDEIVRLNPLVDTSRVLGGLNVDRALDVERRVVPLHRLQYRRGDQRRALAGLLVAAMSASSYNLRRP